MRARVAITGVGMVTAVGLTAEHTCAALRCGIARFAENKDLVGRFGEPVIVARPPVADRGDDDPEARRAHITERAWRQALRELPLKELRKRPVDVYLLSSDMSKPFAFAEEALRTALSNTAEVTIVPLPLGNAAGIAALKQVCDRIADDSRRIGIILGYDNLAGAATLVRLEEAHRLKSSSRARGLIPGEASACVLVESVASAAEDGRAAYACVTSASTSWEDVPIGTPNPCLGTGLTSAISDCLRTAGWDGDMIGNVFCDLNGEEYRAHEWILALSRTSLKALPTHPADCIGDIGASFSPLLLGAAAIALRRRYARTNKILVFCSSESGMRGAVCMAPVPV